MNWLIFALLAPAIYSVVTFIDKYIVERFIKNYICFPVFTGIAGLFAGTVIWFINGSPFLTPKFTLLALGVGFLTSFGMLAYISALARESTSKINILFQLQSLITLFLSVSLLKETISLQQFLGFFLILLSTLVMGIKREKKQFKLSASYFLMLGSVICFSFAYTLFKYITEFNSFQSVFNYEPWGLFIGGIVLFLVSGNIRRAFLKTLNSIKIPQLGVVFLNEGIYLGAKFLTFLAISLGPVALVNVLEGTQVFYAVILGWILTLISPLVFKEEIDRRNLTKKAVLAVATFVGIALLG